MGKSQKTDPKPKSKKGEVIDLATGDNLQEGALQEILSQWIFLALDGKFYDTYTGTPATSFSFDIQNQSKMPADEKGRRQLPSKAVAASPFFRKVKTTAWRPNQERFFEEDGATYFNTWDGFSVQPEEGDPAPFLNHIEFLFGPRTDMVLDWMAHLFQYPGQKVLWGIVHVSEVHGTGRSLIFENLLPTIMGKSIGKVVQANRLNERFQDHLFESLMVCFNEAVGSEKSYFNRAAGTALKEMITSDRFNLRLFGRPPRDERVFTRVVVLSNDLGALEIESEDRRLLAHIHTGGSKPQDYYSEFSQWAGIDIRPEKDQGNGAAIVLHYLMNRDISHFNPAERPPTNDDKSTIASYARGIQDTEVFEDRIEDRDYPFGPDVVSIAQVSQWYDNMTKRRNPMEVRSMVDTLTHCGAVSYNLKKKNGKPRRVFVLRNHEAWDDLIKASSSAVEVFVRTKGEKSVVESARQKAGWEEDYSSPKLLPRGYGFEEGDGSEDERNPF